MTKRNFVVAICTTLIALLVAASAVLLFGDELGVSADDSLPTSTDASGEDGNSTTDRLIYYTYLDKDGDFFFGPNRWVAAQAAVEAGEAKSELEYIVTADGEGDLFESVYHDPSLLGALALECDLEIPEIDSDYKAILETESDLEIGARANAAHLRFLEDESAWDDALARVKSELLADGNSWEIKEIDDYTSAMYMIEDGLEEGKPSVVVRNSENCGGHFIVFHVVRGDKQVDIRLRLECGYQPIEPRWPVPEGKPSIPDVPKTPPEELESKDPADGIEKNKDASHYNWFSDEPQDPTEQDPTPTDEPVSPDDDYKAPTPPPDEYQDQPDTEQPSTEQPEGSSGTDSGSKIQDQSNGGSEPSQTDGQDTPVTAGDGTDRDDFHNANQDPNPTQTPFANETQEGSFNNAPE